MQKVTKVMAWCSGRPWFLPGPVKERQARYGHEHDEGRCHDHPGRVSRIYFSPRRTQQPPRGRRRSGRILGKASPEGQTTANMQKTISFFMINLPYYKFLQLFRSAASHSRSAPDTAVTININLERGCRFNVSLVQMSYRR